MKKAIFFFFVTEDRLNNIKVIVTEHPYVSSDISRPEVTCSSRMNQAVPLGETARLECDQLLTGRYITLVQIAGARQEALSIVEMEVMAESNVLDYQPGNMVYDYIIIIICVFEATLIIGDSIA